MKIEDFTQVQGNQVAVHDIELSIAKKGQTPYISGEIEAAEDPHAQDTTNRDSRRIYRDDHLQLHIGVDENVYVAIGLNLICTI